MYCGKSPGRLALGSHWAHLASSKAGRLDSCPREPSPSLEAASPSLGVRTEQAGSATQVSLFLGEEPGQLVPLISSSSSVPVKRVPWAQAVGTSGAGRRLDSSLPDLPGRMWLSLGENHNPAPPLQTLLSPRVLPAGILRKGLQPGAPAGGRGGEEAPSEQWAERQAHSFLSPGLPRLI